MTSAVLSEFDRNNVGLIVSGFGDWYSAQLLRLIAQADQVNRNRLRMVYPDHVSLYESWERGETWKMPAGVPSGVDGDHDPEDM